MEPQKNNDLFFTCSLIEYIARKTQNTKKEEKYIDTLMEVLESWIIKKIDNYNSSMYYESPEYMYACYNEGKSSINS